MPYYWSGRAVSEGDSAEVRRPRPEGAADLDKSRWTNREDNKHRCAGTLAQKKAVRKTATRNQKPKEVRTDVSAPSDAPLTRGARSRLRTRNKLIVAAHFLMAEKGFKQCTIEEIARLADVGFGSFYNHFKSKEDIARAVFAQRATEIGTLPTTSPRGSPTRPSRSATSRECF